MGLLKIFIACMVIITVFTECSKKKNVADSEFISQSATSSPNTSQDIFDEFYKEDSSSDPDQAKFMTNSHPAVSAKHAKNRYHSKTAGKNLSAEKSHLSIQVSSVKSRAFAEQIAGKLSAKGYPAYVTSVENPTPALPGTYYRVRIGGFSSAEEAKSFAENRLVPDGYRFWIDYKSNDTVGLRNNKRGPSVTASTPARTHVPTPSALQSTPKPVAKVEAKPAPKVFNTAKEKPKPVVRKKPTKPETINKRIAPPVTVVKKTPEETAPKKETQSEENASPENDDQEFTATPSPDATSDINTEWGNEGW